MKASLIIMDFVDYLEEQDYGTSNSNQLVNTDVGGALQNTMIFIPGTVY